MHFHCLVCLEWGITAKQVSQYHSSSWGYSSIPKQLAWTPSPHRSHNKSLSSSVSLPQFLHAMFKLSRMKPPCSRSSTSILFKTSNLLRLRMVDERYKNLDWQTGHLLVTSAQPRMQGRQNWEWSQGRSPLTIPFCRRLKHIKQFSVSVECWPMRSMFSDFCI